MCKKQGFTIIEIVLVIAILGILAVVAMGKFYSWSENAEQNTEAYTIGAIQEGIDLMNANEIVNE